jgi:hypothetical protein
MSGAAVRRAYDRAVREANAPEVRLPRPVLLRPARRVLSVKAALEWAFGAECAQVEFEEAGGHVVGRDTIAVLMDRGSLGCKVDGGGRSLPADDAEIIASFVAALPVGHGGRGMACRVAELARACGAPDWDVPTRRFFEPLDWQAENQHGRFGKTAVVEVIQTVNRGRKTRREVRCTPVRCVDPGPRVASARRDYLRWWGALRHLRDELRLYGRLGAVEVTLDMPPAEPWRARDCGWTQEVG